MDEKNGMVGEGGAGMVGAAEGCKGWVEGDGGEGKKGTFMPASTAFDRFRGRGGL